VNETVLDASVAIKWWRTAGESYLREARGLRASFEAGELAVVAPTLLFIEVLNAFGRRWQWPGDALGELARALKASGFEIEDPDIESVARWTSKGLTAYDASYVALAESRGVNLITTDDKLLSVAPEIARPLTDYRTP
jgi:predicted nucleic acid-binding protein